MLILKSGNLELNLYFSKTNNILDSLTNFSISSNVEIKICGRTAS